MRTPPLSAVLPSVGCGEIQVRSSLSCYISACSGFEIGKQCLPVSNTALHREYTDNGVVPQTCPIHLWDQFTLLTAWYPGPLTFCFSPFKEYISPFPPSSHLLTLVSPCWPLLIFLESKCLHFSCNSKNKNKEKTFLLNHIGKHHL